MIPPIRGAAQRPIAMRASPKKRFEAISAIMPRPERTDAARGPDPANAMLVRKIACKLARPLELAFKKAKLDSGNEEHWTQLTVQLAWTIYGTRGPGAPKSWTKKRLRRLLADVRNIKIDYKRLSSELDCCRQLVKEGKYRETATTLRRVLQTAKKQEQESGLLAAAREPFVVSEVATVLKKLT
jgi:hypothetical protein